jgi:hypothetical protein
MKKIREAEHLSFPLQAEKPSRVSNSELTAKFKVRRFFFFIFIYPVLTLFLFLFLPRLSFGLVCCAL